MSLYMREAKALVKAVKSEHSSLIDVISIKPTEQANRRAILHITAWAQSDQSSLSFRCKMKSS